MTQSMDLHTLFHMYPPLPLLTRCPIPLALPVVVLPGYSATSALTPGVDAAAACPESSYRAGEADYAGAAVPCTLCPAGMRMLPNTIAATSEDACLAPPGFGYDEVARRAAICGLGSFNPGWNREACVACGGGSISTDDVGSTSADDCVLPPGHGTARAGDGSLSGGACPANTYGRGNPTYGLVDVECTKCLDNTHTAGTGMTSGAACLVSGSRRE